MDYSNLCMGCMSSKGIVDKCPHCGYDEKKAGLGSNHLPLRSVLNNRYIVGRALGHGGFGITYIAWDMKLDIPMAVKEYLPSSLATRTQGTKEVYSNPGDEAKKFSYYLDKFLQEARTLAQFSNESGIVSVQDFFRENGTIYIVMFYVNGKNLENYLQENNNSLVYDKTIKIMSSVMRSLAKVHKTGLVHRDISPDNIYVTNDNQVKLLDFGSARYLVSEADKSISIILKRGYAPFEQYSSKGQQGPWTDVYSTAATIYRMLTGEIPPEATERIIEDKIVPPSKSGITIPTYAEKALMKALAVNVQDRYKNMDEFLAALIPETPSVNLQPTEILTEKAGLLMASTRAGINRIKKRVILAVSMVLTVALIEIAIFIVPGVFNKNRSANKEITAANQLDTTENTAIEQQTSAGSSDNRVLMEAEDAVAAYEKASISNMAEITNAKALGEKASHIVAELNDGEKAAVLETRIKAKNFDISEKLAELDKVAAEDSATGEVTSGAAAEDSAAGEVTSGAAEEDLAAAEASTRAAKEDLAAGEVSTGTAAEGTVTKSNGKAMAEEKKAVADASKDEFEWQIPMDSTDSTKLRNLMLNGIDFFEYEPVHNKKILCNNYDANMIHTIGQILHFSYDPVDERKYLTVEYQCLGPDGGILFKGVIKDTEMFCYADVGWDGSDFTWNFKEYYYYEPGDYILAVWIDGEYVGSGVFTIQDPS